MSGLQGNTRHPPQVKLNDIPKKRSRHSRGRQTDFRRTRRLSFPAVTVMGLGAVENFQDRRGEENQYDDARNDRVWRGFGAWSRPHRAGVAADIAVSP